MGETEISWTHKPGTVGRTWNPVQGCRRVSPGCEHCYAERLAARFAETGWSQGLINLKTRKWNGTARLASHKLAEPLRWRQPSTVFVNSMSDLFYDEFSNEQIAAVFGVMAACPQHTFQVLTKRARRMREWFETPGIVELVEMYRQVALAGRIEEVFAPERIVDLEPDWPGYAVTSKGRVISNRKGPDREMKIQHGEQGHRRVQLYHPDGYDERVLVHRLVLDAFDRSAVGDEQGCHINGDATNNALWNLRWGSQSENWDDSKRHGTRRRYSKLTGEQVDEIRRLGADGVSGAEIGRRFGISDTQARNIVNGKQWTPEHKPEWPLSSVWLGVSVENQDAANERIPELLRTPAAVRFLSCEPLLGEVDLERWLVGDCRVTDADDDAPDGEYIDGRLRVGSEWRRDEFLHQVIAGCESGPGSRPCSVEWLRSLRDQCATAGVAFFLKQAVETDMGKCGDADNPNGDDACGERVRYFVHGPKDSSVSCGCTVEGSEDANGCPPLGFGDGSKRRPGGVIELPYLDGVQHAAFPEIRS